MTFSAPAALFLLAAVPLAALLLLQALRRRRRPAAAFFLLRGLVDALPPLPRSFLLRRRLQSLLFLAALACAALAAGGPILGNAQDPPQRVVLLLDTLAPRRDATATARPWRRLTAAAAATARAFRADDRIAVARTDTGIVGGGLLTPRQAAALIERQKPGVPTPETAAGLDLAAALAQVNAAALVGIVTADPDRWRPLIRDRGPLWRVIDAGEPTTATNHALLDVEIRPDLMRFGRIALFCRAGSFGPRGAAAEELSLTVSCDGRPLERRRFRLAPGETHIEVFPALDAGAGLLRVALAPEDAFADDDLFLAPLRGRLAVPALLVTEGNPPLEAALRSLPGLELTVTRQEEATRTSTAAIRIYDGIAPQQPAGNLLVFTPPGGLPGVGYRGEAPSPQLVRADTTHFLLHGVALETLRPARVPVYEIPSGMDVLATADGHPLLAVGRAPGDARLALAAFDPRESGWSYSPSFPILIANLVGWLAESPDGTRTSFRVGDALPASLARSIRGVADPEGAAVAPPAGGWAAFRFPAPGRWRLTGDSPAATGEVSVNLLDERVSAVAYRSAATPDANEPPLAPRPFRAEARLPLLIGAIALLILEQLVAPPQRAGRLS